MSETQRRFLRRVRDANSDGIPRSSIPKRCTHLVESLQTCGAAEFFPSESGRGIVFKISNPRTFSDFLNSRFPMGIDIDPKAILDRASAVLYLNDAKAIRLAVAQGIFVRSAKAGIEITTGDKASTVQVSMLTQEAGTAGLALSLERSWNATGQIALIENADTFWRYELVLPDIDLAILTGGNMSSRFLDWLASPLMDQCKLLYWGDYDPVGVYQYTRLASACAGRVEVYAPSAIDKLLPKHGKASLITRQYMYLDRLRDHDSDPFVRRMIELFDQHRRGLEQEILLHESQLMR